MTKLLLTIFIIILYFSTIKCAYNSAFPYITENKVSIDFNTYSWNVPNYNIYFTNSNGTNTLNNFYMTAPEGNIYFIAVVNNVNDFYGSDFMVDNYYYVVRIIKTGDKFYYYMYDYYNMQFYAQSDLITYDTETFYLKYYNNEKVIKITQTYIVNNTINNNGKLEVEFLNNNNFLTYYNNRFLALSFATNHIQRNMPKYFKPTLTPSDISVGIEINYNLYLLLICNLILYVIYSSII